MKGKRREFKERIEEREEERKERRRREERGREGSLLLACVSRPEGDPSVQCYCLGLRGSQSSELEPGTGVDGQPRVLHILESVLTLLLFCRLLPNLVDNLVNRVLANVLPDLVRMDERDCVSRVRHVTQWVGKGQSWHVHVGCDS